MANKGFIKDWNGNQILPITRGELVLDAQGNIALASDLFLAGTFKDALDKPLPGLITAAERAMLTGGGSGEGIADIYNKLLYINTGFKVNGNALNFYTEENSTLTHTPISFTGTSLQIALNVNNNTVNIGLAALHTGETTVSNILRSIKVDTYGRVLEVSGAVLTNEDIPDELTGKTITNGILNNCVTSQEEIDTTNSKAIINKAYLEQRLQDITGLATGALKFGGPLSDVNSALAVLENSKYLYHYYKVTGPFKIEAQYLYSETESSNDQNVKSGDTLIVYPVDQGAKFVYVPSGDEVITTITVTTEDSAADPLSKAVGDITLRFSKLFEVNATAAKTATISIPKATSSLNGYLSSEDYTIFSSYAENLLVSYKPSITSEVYGAYQLGTLNVGKTPYIIYGLNFTYTIAVENGTVNEYNPVLKFTENGSTDTSITYQGTNGILVRKNSNAILFAANNEVLALDVPQPINPRTAKYLKITNGYQFEVQLGSVDNSGNVTDGLTDFSQFNALVNRVSSLFEIFDYSLNGAASTTEYRYGNDKLIAAVKITI